MNRAELALLICVICGAALSAEDHGHEHGSGSELDFWHPLITESPFPEREIDFSYQHLARSRDEDKRDVESFSIGGEYALWKNFSLEAHAPAAWPDRGGGVELGAIDLGFKYASFALEDRGILLAAGLEAELPNEDVERGEDRRWGLAPFFGAGIKRGPWEFIAFARPALSFHGRTDVDLEFDVSILRFIHKRVALLAELNGSSRMNGTGRGDTTLTVSPGIKFQPFINDHNIEFGVNATIPVTSRRDQSWAAGFFMICHF